MAEDDAPKIEGPAEEVKAEPQAAPSRAWRRRTVAEQVLLQTAAPPEAVAEQVLSQTAAPPEAVLEQVLSQTATPPEAAPPPPAPEAAPALQPAPAPQPAPVAQAPAWDGPLLRIEGVVKTFGGFRAVDGVSLDIRAGEFFALLGPSGCGKTTLLRMLAGFETPDEGRILLGGKDIAHVLPHERPINMMFQSYALFPHLSVRDNIAFGLKRARMARAEIDARVAEMVTLVKLGGLEKRKPDQLSGGQRQRVALARSLARRPQVLLLDEPLAALDKKLRESTQLELMELQRRLGMTFIIVTHDQEEAMTVASRIGVMDAGRLDQVASPRELYEAPASRWIAEFIGDINVFEGEVGSRENNRIMIATRDAGTVVVAEPRQPITKADRRGRDPSREGQAVAARAGRCGQCASDQPARRRRHRRQLSRRPHHLQDQARFRRHGALLDGQHRADRHRRLQPEPARGAPGSRPTIAWCWSNERAAHLRAACALRRDRALCLDGAVLPGAVRIRAEDQPVADRDRAAALYAGVRFRRGKRRHQGSLRRAVARQFPAARLRQSLSLLLSAQSRRRRDIDRDPAPDRLSHRLRHGAAAAALAAGRDDAGHRAVLDLVPDPHLCLDQHPAA